MEDARTAPAVATPACRNSRREGASTAPVLLMCSGALWETLEVQTDVWDNIIPLGRPLKAGRSAPVNRKVFPGIKVGSPLRTPQKLDCLAVIHAGWDLGKMAGLLRDLNA